MAQQTTNYDLWLPEATDSFSEFREKFNENMETIDENLGGGGGGSGGHTIVNPSGSAMTQRTNLKFAGSCTVTDDSVNNTTIVNITGGGGGGEGTRTYYARNGQISDGPNQQFLSVTFDTPLTEGSDYVVAFKNSSGGQIVSKMLFDYATDFTIYDFDTRCSIGRIDLTITSTTITTIDYSGSWQDIYVDVYRNAGSVGVVTTEMVYTGKEDEYHSDSSFTPMEFDTRTEGTDFSTYLSTSDHKTFTVLQDFACVVTLGCEQDPNHSSGNTPNCTFFVNNAPAFRIEPSSSSSGSNAITTSTTILFAGDTFYWGSNNTSGYAVRLGQIDILMGYNLSNYTKPSF